jgi:hypothetical protein
MFDRTSGRYGFDKLAVRLKLSRHIPLPAPPATSQVTKRGIADRALHNLLAILHRELNAIKSASYPTASPRVSGMNPAPFQ